MSKPKFNVPPSDLPTGKFTITVNMFRSLGGVFPISATLVPSADNPPCIQFDRGQIVVSGGLPVRLVFLLPNPNPTKDPGYILLGAAFASNSPTPTVGLHTFPDVSITTVDSGTSRQMILTDHPQPVGLQQYDYVLMVQSVKTAEIGIIDPQIINDND